MHFANLLKLAGLTLFVALGVGGSAQAATKCRLDGGTVAFGEYRSTSSSHLDVLGLVTLSCDRNYQVELSLSVGTGSGASYAGGRILTGSSAGSTLRYNLYTDASRTLVLGDGTGGSSRLSISGKETVNQIIWGRIPGGQRLVPADRYSDTLIATVSY
jgi:hypothetical protein